MDECTLKQHAAVRNGAGWWALEDVMVLRISGPDAAAYLHGQATSDVLSLEEGGGQHGALLEPKAQLIAFFTLHRLGGEFLLVGDRSRRAATRTRLEKYLIDEEVRIGDESDRHLYHAVQGPQSRPLLAAAWPRWALPDHDLGVAPFDAGGDAAFAAAIGLAGEDGFLLACSPEAAGEVRRRLLAAGEPFGLVEVDPEAREILRVEAGLPRPGVDYDDGHRLPETGLERLAVSYTKGCYVGQEVVARLKTYGAIAQALVGLRFEGETLPERGAALVAGGKEVGTIASGVVSPAVGAPICLAYLHRDLRASERTIEFEAGGERFRAAVVVLPFHRGVDRRQRAQSLAEEGMRRFVDGDEEEGIGLLRRAVVVDPRGADAYEGLGVALARRGEYEEAIVLMKELARLDPEQPMAYSNMSLYYMKLGFKTEAEEAQGKATLASMKKAAREARKEKDLADELARRARSFEERLGMFRQVLLIDPDDHLASFGLGKGFLDSGRPAEALPYLEKAASLAPDHSAGYPPLGACLEALSEPRRARDVYERGIAVATRRGDLMPLKEMERRLAGLGGVV